MGGALFGIGILVFVWAWRLARSPRDPRWVQRLEPLCPLRGRWLRYFLAVTASLGSFLLWLPVQVWIPVGSGLLLVSRFRDPLCCVCPPAPPQGFSVTRLQFYPNHRLIAFRIEDEIFGVLWVPDRKQ